MINKNERTKSVEGQNIKVSVVMATYNHEKYIGHALESAINQKTDFKYEILVGEDCSTDGTAKIVKEYAEKYPDKINARIREKNLGMSGNIVDLMMAAKGEYIAFLEGDDYWIDENKLQKQADFLDNHPEHVAVFGKCIMVDADEKRMNDIEQYNCYVKTGGEYTVKEFQEYLFPGQTATSMYRKSSYGAIQKKVMDVGINAGRMKDVTQILCMLSVGKMYVLDDELAAYRYVMPTGSGSWSSENDYYSADNVINYLNDLKDMEKIASVLNLPLNFDERRKLEFEKLGDNKQMFSTSQIRQIRRAIIRDCKSKINMFLFLLKRHI